MSGLLDAASAIAIAAGVFFVVAGTVGVLRFPDALTRLHAVTKADSLGLGLIVLGLLPQAHTPMDAAKLVAVWALVQLAGTTTTQLLAHTAQRGDGPP